MRNHDALSAMHNKLNNITALLMKNILILRNTGLKSAYFR
ncbi:hypothetical protein SPHINGO8BC_51693 [Sphingobacterium multivorum]|uniref:Uncharacterized protein n=1 Tax=Sphingobacterium multivorum TaxID=28454 RepID=A0A654D728_SPHMU|nr:hypothetical protein SPHINGO8BC_51693 [Sphingobacterium multivorum]